jgi:uncharacterized protein (TIGR00369 family)
MTTEQLSGLEFLREIKADDMPPVAKLLGWEALDLQPGYAKVRFVARPEFCNPTGAIQGGLLAAMLDDTMGPAGFTTLEAGQFAPTLELKMNFLRPAAPGILIGEGRLVHRTKRVLFLEGTLATEDGEVLATATATATLPG